MAMISERNGSTETANDTPKKEASKNSSWMKILVWYVIPLLVANVANIVVRLKNAGHPMSFIYPNYVLFFPGNNRFLSQHWPTIVENSTQKFTPEPIPEIPLEEFSEEKLKEATQNYFRPVVMRGMFSGTPAQKNWVKPGYLSSKIGPHKVRAIHLKPFPSPQNNRTVMPIADAMHEILTDPESYLYLFFPVLGTNTAKDVEVPELKVIIDKIVLEDLELEKRIKPGYATKSDRTWKGANLLMGNGKSEKGKTTGTAWHNAIGSNYFIQVVGRKRWYFLDPKWGPNLHMVRGSPVNFMTGSYDSVNFQDYLPTRFVDLNPGDAIYVPDWQWHSVSNYEGLSIGVATRNFKFLKARRNSALYTMICLSSLLRQNLFGMFMGDVATADPQNG
eukprot:CAMPEP_0118680262 /NCGR_PEP_ID=MMETSP0800-20121206/4259_1 /TAXON_ID=210618 ORGANISM="Striatella unipunctata, Strain CCMP2910" /NCGR_SAMPLE_ID=MMETSP0800 /ASSEMBLY_ACC=CAM_ASM_000638 /LENGTH=389 /DNA_ID=CAMNT_0006576375 /DNA_START=97 /DNA_END=1266 /DNA_ORIENTATION=+